MSVKDDLFQLIRSMSKSEKRYFKLDTRKGGDKTNNYLRLFDALNSMEAYDEEKIRKKFKEEKFIKHLSQEKKYLYESILRSMRNYQSDKSSVAQIKEGLLDARYLYERGLYRQSEKVLKRIKKIAYRLGDVSSTLEIIQTEYQLVNESQRQSVESELNTLALEKDKLLAYLEDEFKYLDLYYRLITKVAQRFELKDTDMKEYLDGMHLIDYIKQERLPVSKNAQRRYYQSMASYYQLKGKYEKSYESYKKVIEWWEENVELRQQESYRYKIDLSNFIQISFFLNKRENLDALLEKLDEQEFQNFHEQSVIFLKVTINQFLFYLNNYDFEKTKELIPKIEVGIKKYPVNETSKTVLIINVALLFFVLERFSDCITWVNKVISDQKSRNRQDLQFLARILKLICLYELGEIDKFDSFVRVVSRFFLGNKLKKSSFEINILNMLKKIANTPSAQQKELFQMFHTFLIDFEEKNKYPGVGELILWAKSNIQKRPILTLIEEQKTGAKRM